MPNVNIRTQLSAIIQQINITTEGALSVNGIPQNNHYSPEADVDVQLQRNLQNTLYSLFYTQSSSAVPPKEDLNHPDFLNYLQRANTSVQGFNEGWQVEEIGHDGNILVKKGASKRYTYAGDFLRAQFGQGKLQQGENIKLHQHKEFVSPQDNGFYFVFGQTLADQNNSSLVRFYFNLNPQKVVAFVELLTQLLNDWAIPFQFKCLQSIRAYPRADSGVLYLDKRYFQIASTLLQKRYSTFSSYLNEAIPLFSKRIASGIGFAENPFDTNDSFGTNRCKVIAQGLVEAWRQQLPKTEWLTIILQLIERNFLDVNQIHLNPNSKYPYYFPNFEN